MRRSHAVLVYAVLLAVAAAFPAVANEQLLTAGITALEMVYLAQCWNLLAGYAGQFSLGHSLFIGIGAYASTLLFQNARISPWLGSLIGASLSAAVGTVFGALAFRYRVKGIFFAVLTLGSVEVARGIAQNWDYIGGTNGIFLSMADAPFNMLFLDHRPYYWIILAMVLGMVVLSATLEQSKLGQSLLAIKENEDAAEAAGVDAFRYKLIALALSAALTSLGGTFYAQFLLYISPDTTFVFEHQLEMMLGTMVGGAGTVIGPVIGSAVFSLVAEALRHLPLAEDSRVDSAAQMVYAVTLIVLMLRLPGGLVSLVRRRGRLSSVAIQADSG